MAMQPPPPAPPYVPAPPYGAVSPTAARGYAGFWIRFAAYLIDAVIAGGVAYGVLAVTKPIQCITVDGTTCVAGTTTISPLFYAIIAIPVVYSIVLWAVGGTIGQRAFRLRVVDAKTGGNLGFGKSILRYVGFIISTIPIYLGLIWAGFDSRKQGWHDKIAGSLVVRKA